MRKEIADKWAEALRSGDYEQQMGSLANLHRTRHCCMGVLCEVAIENGVEIDTCESVPGFDDERAYLPFRVQAWAGIRNRYGQSTEGDVNLVAMNDCGHGFDEIASTIEVRWEEL